MNDIVAVVAGASRGAGKGAALALGEIGATVYALARTGRADELAKLGSVDDTAEEVTRLGGAGLSLICDCSDAHSLHDTFARIGEERGRVDVLVNSAWGLHDVDDGFGPGPFHARYESAWDRMFRCGVRNYLACACEAIPLLQKSSNGLIANISFWDEDRYTGDLFYDLAKTSMNRLAFGLGHELKKDGVAAVSLSPGFMQTEHVMASLEEDPSLADKFGVPTESTRYVGRAVAALAQDPNRMMKSGRTLRVADLAREYGFVDLDGTQPEAFRLPDPPKELG